MFKIYAATWLHFVCFSVDSNLHIKKKAIYLYKSIVTKSDLKLITQVLDYKKHSNSDLIFVFFSQSTSSISKMWIRIPPSPFQKNKQIQQKFFIRLWWKTHISNLVAILLSLVSGETVPLLPWVVWLVRSREHWAPPPPLVAHQPAAGTAVILCSVANPDPARSEPFCRLQIRSNRLDLDLTQKMSWK